MDLQVIVHRLCPLLLCVLVLRCHVAHGLFDWLKPAETPPPAQTPPIPPATAPPAKDFIPFEMTVADEKFLVEVKQMDLSPLGSCHYKVIAQLKSTCESLSEEQLAKVGVRLYNCQAQVEGRRTYPCSEGMTIKECTAEMDSDTWTAYHVVSNRVRSVCYSTRQLGFRRKAELTVNALISTASSQLDAMKDLKAGQAELKDLTAASLDKLQLGHRALHDQQGVLRAGQGQLESSLRVNLEQLGQEKALIASGQELVARLIQDITHKMEDVSDQLKGQGSEVQEGHQAIIQDLADVRDKAQDIYHKIDHSMLEVLQYQDTTTQYHTDLMAKLERMNATLGSMLHYLDAMQTRIEGRLHVIQGYLGWAGLSLAAVCTCVVHAGYLLLGAVLLTFLRSPAISRATLLVTVPLNAAAEVNQQPSLDFRGLCLLLLTLTLGHWLLVHQLVRAWRLVRGWAGRREETSHPSTPPRSLMEQSFISNVIPCEEPLYLEDRQSTPKAGRWSSISAYPVNASVPRRSLALGDSLNGSQSSNSSVLRRPCCGITKTGKACRKSAVSGQDYCRVHEGGSSSYVQS
ncbi:hypothetical protein CRUP_034581 [Coryphaenoides rupestris]|nr:hypothetical protein CRUP_034581 [Coryphaenoides rupestris]